MRGMRAKCFQDPSLSSTSRLVLRVAPLVAPKTVTALLNPHPHISCPNGEQRLSYSIPRKNLGVSLWYGFTWPFPNQLLWPRGWNGEGASIPTNHTVVNEGRWCMENQRGLSNARQSSLWLSNINPQLPHIQVIPRTCPQREVIRNLIQLLTLDPSPVFHANVQIMSTDSHGSVICG